MHPVTRPVASPHQALVRAAPGAAALQELRALIGAPPPGGHRRDLLIEHLHQLKDHYHGLFERHLVALASDMQLPQAEVDEVAGFYHPFELLRDDQMPARLTVQVCDSLSCALAGSAALMSDLPAMVGPDVRVLAVPCLGRCEQAPAVLVGQQAVPHADSCLVLAAVADEPSATAATGKSASSAIDFVALQAYRENGGYALAAAVVNGEEPAQAVISAIEDAGLRGVGAGGLVGRQWRTVREQSAPRVMAVNLDGREPGSFQDRSCLERDPHRFLEGMLIAAQVTGTEACYIYLRNDYHDLRLKLTGEIEALQSDPPCPLPHIELRRAAGACVCGDESAMIESMEGKCAVPRRRPSAVAQAGLFGQPTLVHDFESLYWVRDIFEKGPTGFSAWGRRGRHGLRSFSVSGRVKQPGVKLAPAGITLQELLDEHCGGMLDGHTLYAFLPGGASGGILPAHLGHGPLDLDTSLPAGRFIGSAAIVVLSQHDRARDAALHAMRFFATASCSQCMPCRVGSATAARLMQAPVWDMARLTDLNAGLAGASSCALGQAASKPVRCVQKYFSHEISGAS